ncbi:MAG TPA: class I SAM-dependent methyltransferase, partial [Gemmatimonadaceae bacterium]|nr:class I SAM-dependent methyltransferase [Gemmatimonadaceae bacterium]
MASAAMPLAPRRVRCGVVVGNVIETIARNPLPDAMRERSQRVWSAGDYDSIAAGFRDDAAAFVERQRLKRGMRVLDAACGSGNLTIPAARTGANVVGLDLVWSLIEQAAEWGQREGLSIVFDEGTVEDMPYADFEFDAVLSMFGLMFAARPERVAAELARVTKPGGKVALANWTKDGFVGRMFALHVKYAPPPAGTPSSLLWGDEATVRERLDAHNWDVTTSRKMLRLGWPLTPRGVADLFGATYGPTVRTLETLDARKRAQFLAELAELWAEANRKGGHETAVDSEYLEVVA